MPRPLLLLLVFAACSGERPLETEGRPDGPPRLGTVSAALDGAAVEWGTYDFSVGAFDASAWIRRDGDGRPALRVDGFAPGTERDESEPRLGRLSIRGAFAGEVAPGELRGPVIRLAPDLSATPGLSSEGLSGASVTVEAVRLDGAGTGYGDASGRFSATLCPEPGAVAEGCRTIEGRFGTRLQFEGL